PDREEPLLDEDRLQQGALAREVVVQRGHVEAGGGRQVPHARPVDAPLGHQGQGDLQDPSPGRRALSGGGPSSRCVGVAPGGRASAHSRSHFSALRPRIEVSSLLWPPTWAFAPLRAFPLHLPCPAPVHHKPLCGWGGGRARTENPGAGLPNDRLLYITKRSFNVNDTGVRSDPGGHSKSRGSWNDMPGI